MRIGENIKEALAAKGWTQAALAEKLGVKQNTVSQWVTGVNEPDCKTIVLLCEFLEITPNILFGWE